MRLHDLLKTAGDVGGKITGKRGMAFCLLLPLLVVGNLWADQSSLRVMIWEGYGPEEYVAAFEKKMEVKYGRKVKLEFSIAASADDFFNAIRDKSVDVVTLSHHDIKDERFAFITKKLILPFDLENIPNYSNMIKSLQISDFYISDDKVYGIPIANGPYGLAYSTEAFSSAPKSWKVFWDPTFKGKYCIGAHEYLYNVNITALALGFPRESINSYDALANTTFKKKLRQLAINANSLWIGVDKPADLIGLSFATSWGDSLAAMKRKGIIWKMADPVEGTMWWIDVHALTWSLADKPFIKKIAEEWINRSLEPDFQVDHLTREVGIYPVTTNIAGRLTNEEKKKVLYSSPGEFTKRRILQQIHSQRDRNGMKALWNEALKGIMINGK